MRVSWWIFVIVISIHCFYFACGIDRRLEYVLLNRNKLYWNNSLLFYQKRRRESLATLYSMPLVNVSSELFPKYPNIFESEMPLKEKIDVCEVVGSVASNRDLLFVFTTSNELSTTIHALSYLTVALPSSADLIIVDDHSIDGTVEYLSRRGFHVISKDSPRGLTHSWNLGYNFARSFGYKYVIFANNDVLVPRGAIHVLVEDLKRHTVVVPMTSRVGAGHNPSQSLLRIHSLPRPFADYINNPHNVQSIQDGLLRILVEKVKLAQQKGDSFETTIYSTWKDQIKFNGFFFGVNLSTSWELAYRDPIELFDSKMVMVGQEDALVDIMLAKVLIPRISIYSFVYHFKSITVKKALQRTTRSNFTIVVNDVVKLAHRYSRLDGVDAREDLAYFHPELNLSASSSSSSLASGASSSATLSTTGLLQDRYQPGRLHRPAIRSQLISSSIRIGFIVSDIQRNPGAGDLITAHELGQALSRHYEVDIQYFYKSSPLMQSWYNSSHLSQVDVVISMLDDFDVSVLWKFFPVLKPRLVTLAWIRNWIHRWADRSYLGHYDYLLVSSSTGANFLRQVSDSDCKFSVNCHHHCADLQWNVTKYTSFLRCGSKGILTMATPLKVSSLSQPSRIEILPLATNRGRFSMEAVKAKNAAADAAATTTTTDGGFTTSSSATASASLRKMLRGDARSLQENSSPSNYDASSGDNKEERKDSIDNTKKIEVEKNDNESIHRLQLLLSHSYDYLFAGSYFNQARKIMDFDPSGLPFRGLIVGHNWNRANVSQAFRSLVQEYVPYTWLPQLYCSTKIIIDDANHATEPWGSVNSRVFDALSCGALVLTNGVLGSVETFGGLLPIYTSAAELRQKLVFYLTHEEERRNLVRNLQQVVWTHHTYDHRSHQLVNVLRSLGVTVNPRSSHNGVSHDTHDDILMTTSTKPLISSALSSSTSMNASIERICIGIQTMVSQKEELELLVQSLLTQDSKYQAVVENSQIGSNENEATLKSTQSKEMNISLTMKIFIIDSEYTSPLFRQELIDLAHRVNTWYSTSTSTSFSSSSSSSLSSSMPAVVEIVYPELEPIRSRPNPWNGLDSLDNLVSYMFQSNDQCHGLMFTSSSHSYHSQWWSQIVDTFQVDKNHALQMVSWDSSGTTPFTRQLFTEKERQSHRVKPVSSVESVNSIVNEKEWDEEYEMNKKEHRQLRSVFRKKYPHSTKKIEWDNSVGVSPNNLWNADSPFSFLNQPPSSSSTSSTSSSASMASRSQSSSHNSNSNNLNDNDHDNGNGNGDDNGNGRSFLSSTSSTSLMNDSNKARLELGRMEGSEGVVSTGERLEALDMKRKRKKLISSTASSSLAASISSTTTTAATSATTLLDGLGGDLGSIIFRAELWKKANLKFLDRSLFSSPSSIRKNDMIKFILSELSSPRHHLHLSQVLTTRTHL